MRIADWVQGLRDRQELSWLGSPVAGAVRWSSIAVEARPIFVAAQYLAHPRRTMILAASYERALQWQAKLQLAGVPQHRICQLPSGLSALFEDAAPEHITLSDRLGALRALTEDEPWVVISTASAALERTLPRETLESAFVEVKKGQTLDSDGFLQKLVNLGYEPAEPVRQPGQYSRRGGILDVYPAGADAPVRIELFDDEVESVRTFDPNSQRSTGMIPALGLAPSRETIYTSTDDGLSRLVLESAEREALNLEPEAAARLEELIAGDAQALAGHIYFDRLDLYRPLLHPDSGCAIDLLGDDDLLILDEPIELEAIANRAEEELGASLEARAERGEILKSSTSDFTLPLEHLGEGANVLSLSSMNAFPSWTSSGTDVEIEASSLEPYRGRADALAKTLETYKEQGFSVLFSTDQPSRAKAVLSQADIYPKESLEGGIPAGESVLATGNLAGGFSLPHSKIAVVTDAELFGVGRLKLPQKRFKEGAPIATVLDLKAGDYVVHINFGIGIFRGLAKREIEGVEKEFLFIEYAAPDKLFVPADQLDRIQKYLNPGDEHPKLNKLTGGEWQRTLGKAKEEAKAFARDLVKLYAQRKRVARRGFGPDTPWQAEMEGTFPWVETPSQLLAIEETKRDLQQDFPMDRLVCGDVGFGKTEVAIRAAFKVAQAGRQVAVLCPTTILSEQHARNFEERLGAFSVRVALLNRFRSAAERRKILAELEAGKVDIIIGTHSLLGQEVKFKELGLVIIDEEQKFGVKQKELLKQLRTEVDVLTLSATPIPRTLSMALMDIRQMSLINDPPPGRLPIRTFLRPYSPDVVREAILRELARGGQIFYVYNRVQGISHVAERLRQLAPMARIGVGHGQMTEAELEPIMIGFIKGEIDILLSTTIIENGIDISNANTLIVEDADRLGLSQLYQLRGRVGRSDRQAYAYLLYQSHKDLNQGALQRLQALQEFSTLGSGYSLAFRDLQIRGAGELLGAKQHGAMAAVGYELYTQLINEAVQILKNSVDGESPDLGEPRDPLETLAPLPTLELPVTAFLPDSYIKDQAQRLYYYQKMMSARDLSGLGEAQAEIEDRYGRAPEPAANAFEIMAQRMRARDLGIDKIDGKGGRLSASFVDKAEVPPRVWSLLGKMNRDAYVTKENFIWPYSGSALSATKAMLGAFDRAHAQVESERRELGAV